MAFGRAHDVAVIVGYIPQAQARAHDVSVIVGFMPEAQARAHDLSLIVGYIPLEEGDPELLVGQRERDRPGLIGSFARRRRKQQ